MSDLGLSIAVSGLLAQKQSIDVISQNIANASTDGYSRQRVELETKNPWPSPSVQMASGPGQFGTGVEVEAISRTRDLFLDQQIRQQNGLQGEWQQRSDALSQVETVFTEPSTTGLSSVMSSFWSAWNQLSETADSSPVRATVAASATTLADTLRSTYGQLQTLQGNLNDQIGIKVSHVNDDLTQIGALNKQIQIISISGLTPNDLMDRRDALLKDLSQTVNIQTTMQKDNTVTVAVGNATVVSGPDVTKLQLVTDSKGNNQVGLELGSNSNIISWADLSGELQGLAYARDNDVGGYMTGLDQLATSLANQVNTQHMQGYGLNGETGIPFFVGSDNAVAPPATASQVTSAGSIYVNPYITANTDRIGAATGLTQSTTTTQGVASSTAQVETLTVGSGATASGTLKVVLTAAGMGNSPKTLSVAVAAGDSASAIAGKIQTALNSDSDIQGFFTVGGTNADVTLTAKTASANDDTMKLAVYGNNIASGDNGNALLISQLKDQQTTFKDGTGTVISTATTDSFFNSMISKLGVDSSQAKNMVTNQKALVAQLQNKADSVSGVSLDEEMASLTQYQTAYEASAKLINVIDAMMATVINMVPAQ
ncbi:MAG: flagellar hook-associated protein FlgK [Thermacetogeniaceae bacterium]